MTTRKLDAHAGGGGDSPTGYLHGYSAAERDRLQRQARFLEPLVHDRLPYRRKRKLLEVGSAPALLNAGEVTSDVVDGMRKELARAARDPNCVFFYAFIQARARAW